MSGSPARRQKQSTNTETPKKTEQKSGAVHDISEGFWRRLVDSNDPATIKLHLQMMRQSCAFFAQEVLRGPNDGKFIISDHHLAWDEMVTTSRRSCALAPRDHGKTFFFDFAYPIWKMVFHPKEKGYIFSATMPQAERILEDIKEEIETNEKLSWLLPFDSELDDGNAPTTKARTKKKWTSRAITLRNGHKVYARGYGTKVRGAHPNWIVVDDGLNDEDAYSEVTRKKNIDYFYTAISNMVVPDGQIVVVGTPFSGADLYSTLKKNPEYNFKKFSALQDGKPLWPARYSKEALERKRREIGSIRFTREFECEPISDEMSLFPERLFRGQPIEQFNVTLGHNARYWKSLGIESIYMGVDLAISSSTSADATVIFIMGIDAYQNRWVLDIQRFVGLAYSEQLSKINTAARRYKVDIIYIESNQMQRVFGDELIRNSDLPIMKFFTNGNQKHNSKKLPSGNTTSANKNSLAGGVPSLRVLLENGKFRIPRGDTNSVEVTEQWIEEMKSFTWADGKLQGVGAHDDTVLACWICDQAIRQTGFAYSDGSEDIDDKQTLEEILKEAMGSENDGPYSDADDAEFEETTTETKTASKPKKAKPKANALSHILNMIKTKHDEDADEDDDADIDDPFHVGAF